jgi:hypothetical protein
MKYLKDYLNLTEGLIKTYDKKIILGNVLERLSLLKVDISGKIINDSKISIQLNNIKHISYERLNNIADIIYNTVVNTGGYFISYIEVENIHGLKNKLKDDLYEVIKSKEYYISFNIIFESKFEETSIIPDFLYHLTIEEYRNKILKNGLTPKSKDKLSNSLDRIYLCSTIEDCEKLIPEMEMYYNMERDKNMYVLNKKKYSKDVKPLILKIDTKNIIKLYKDPNYINGYFTVDNILSENITII